MKAVKRKASAANMVTVVNSLTEYFHADVAIATDIRTPMLGKYEAYLRRLRDIERLGQFQNSYKEP